MKPSDLLRNILRDSIFGLQDAVVSTCGALLGIAAGTNDHLAVTVAGFVIVAVESLSMMTGSYLSSKTEREFLDSLLEKERESIRRDPEGEKREIWEMYRSRGYSDKEIRMIERRLFSDEKLLLEDMAFKELGICPQASNRPHAGAIAMGLGYVVGGLFPVVPYLLFPVRSAMAYSVASSIVALFVIGAGKGVLVRRSWWKSGAEMLIVAGLASVAGYLIGKLAGAAR